MKKINDDKKNNGMKEIFLFENTHIFLYYLQDIFNIFLEFKMAILEFPS